MKYSTEQQRLIKGAKELVQLFGAVTNNAWYIGLVPSKKSNNLVIYHAVSDDTMGLPGYLKKTLRHIGITSRRVKAEPHQLPSNLHITTSVSKAKNYEIFNVSGVQDVGLFEDFVRALKDHHKFYADEFVAQYDRQQFVRNITESENWSFPQVQKALTLLTGVEWVKDALPDIYKNLTGAADKHSMWVMVPHEALNTLTAALTDIDAKFRLREVPGNALQTLCILDHCDLSKLKSTPRPVVNSGVMYLGNAADPQPNAPSLR